MTTAAEGVLVPVRLDQSPPPHLGAHYDVSGSSRISPPIVKTLAPGGVVLLGYWPVPDQSSPQQLRDQFGDEARQSLDVVKQHLEDQRFEITTELQFTKHRDDLIDRVANSHGCTSVLFPGTVRSTPPERILVLLKSDSDVDRIVRTLATLFTDSSVDISLFHAVERGDDVEAIDDLLREVADHLENRGIHPDRIRWERSDRGSRADTIVSEAADHDLVVLGESEPSLRERIFGPVQSAVADRTERPSLTIRADT